MHDIEACILYPLQRTALQDSMNLHVPNHRKAYEWNLLCRLSGASVLLRQRRGRLKPGTICCEKYANLSPMFH